MVCNVSDAHTSGLWGKCRVFNRMAFPSLQNCWFCWTLHGLNITTAFIPGGIWIFLFGIETAAADFCLIAGQFKHGQRGVCTSVSFSEGVGSQWGKGGGRKSSWFFYFFSFLVVVVSFPLFSFSGLKAADRTSIQNEWMEEKIPVIVATISFGMGVDKANVRCVRLSVVHH